MNIKIEKYTPSLKQKFIEIKKHIISKLPDTELYHIGSTAIDGCDARPIVDILGIVADITSISTIDGFEALEEYGIVHQRFFRKAGEIHLHIFEDSDPEAARHLRFVSYMKRHPEFVEEYSQLKHKLARECSSIESYINGKASFIKQMDYAAIKEEGMWPHHDRPRKKDFSNLEMKEAMSCNFIAFFSYFAPYTSMLSAPYNPDVTIVTSHIPHDEFNNVFGAKFTQNCDARIAYVNNQFEPGIPFSWWVYDLDTPSDLPEKLLEHGFIKKDEIQGMVLPLANFSEPTSQNRIERVLSTSSLKTFFKIYDDSSHFQNLFDPLFTSLSPHLFEKKAPLELYILYENNQPVTIGIAFFHANVVGIYYIMTCPPMRKKGYGSQMMHFLLARAKSLGYHLATLQSSEEGMNLYTHIGFRELSHYTEFVIA